jgi:predicted transcriptional regulator
MRKINPRNFRRATRSTTRDVNRQILLSLVQEHQPVSRADLARRMGLGRGRITNLVNSLIEEGMIRLGRVLSKRLDRRWSMMSC